MFILAASGSCYARLRLGGRPGGQLELPVQIDFSQRFTAASPETWAQEYADCVELSPDMFSSLDESSYVPHSASSGESATGWPRWADRLRYEPLGWGGGS
jgi:hypothetical protein